MSDLLLILIALAVVVIAFYFIKASKRCLKCKAEWSWKLVSKIDRPASTFVRNDGFGGGDGRSVFEVGTRLEDYRCNKCGHSVRTEGSYKKRVY